MRFHDRPRGKIRVGASQHVLSRRDVSVILFMALQIFLGDASNFGPEYYSAYAVAATLFIMTFILTVIGHRIRVRFREVYE